MLPRAFESIYLFVIKRGYIRRFPKGDVIIFAFTLALTMYAYQCEPKALGGAMHTLIHKIFGEN